MVDVTLRGYLPGRKDTLRYLPGRKDTLRYLPGRKDTLRQRRRERTAREQLASAARRYAALGWPVCQGAHPEPASRGRGRPCSCDRIGCPAPGAHPVSAAWPMQASADPGAVGRYWAAAPEANVILVTGRVFDVLDAPAPAGLAALEQMERSGVATGPVAAGVAGRTLFFVATRGAHGAQDEWWHCRLDCVPEDEPAAAGLRWHCRNSYVLAPPCRNGAGQAARWLREPEGRPLPDAVRLLEYLAYLSGSRVMQNCPPGAATAACADRSHRPLRPALAMRFA